MGEVRLTVSVAALLMNEREEVLLVKTHWRADTWEMPGGNVEAGEPLDKAVCREVREETGIVIRPLGISGVYFNATKHVLVVVFKAAYVSGEIAIQPEEIQEARYIAITEANIDHYITRPQQRSRTLDALKAERLVPYETWEVGEAYRLAGRVSPDPE
ncbi:NUDIX hydrolase [Paenibacillus cymbidii]|uniref:NUDIX hydrolase n=1 Tax=Paenibacillus cymbidii TaxID=1639034 RepID=UPI0010814CE5|nr:NUDIX hydrolase [Paenibacillus cymbidii]